MKPKTFLPSKSHPDYRKEEIDYVLKGIFSARKVKKWQEKGSPLLDRSRDIESKDTLAEYYRSQIRRRRNLVVTEKGRPGERATDFVIKAIEIFDVDALRLSGPEEQTVRGNDTRNQWLGSLKLRDDLGAAVCSVVRGLREQVVKGNSYANKRLQSILKALIPETRGTKGINTTPFDVLSFYYKKMFQLYHIQNALLSTPGTPRAKVLAASQNFGMPVDQIRELWNLDNNDQPKSRPVPIKERARRVTARHFGITQHTVSNIIASYP